MLLYVGKIKFEFWYLMHALLFRVVAVDLRGYGDSSKPSSVAEYSLKKLVGDIEALIKALGNT